MCPDFLLTEIEVRQGKGAGVCQGFALIHLGHGQGLFPGLGAQKYSWLSLV